MRSEEEIKDLIAKLEITKSDMDKSDMDIYSGTMLITDSIEMSIMNLKWVLEDTDER